MESRRECAGIVPRLATSLQEFRRAALHARRCRKRQEAGILLCPRGCARPSSDLHIISSSRTSTATPSIGGSAFSDRNAPLVSFRTHRCCSLRPGVSRWARKPAPGRRRLEEMRPAFPRSPGEARNGEPESDRVRGGDRWARKPPSGWAGGDFRSKSWRRPIGPAGRMIDARAQGRPGDVGAQFLSLEITACALGLIDAMGLNGSSAGLSGKIQYALRSGDSLCLRRRECRIRKLFGVKGNLELYVVPPQSTSSSGIDSRTSR